MKIIVVNYRYFVAGGPERYMFNIIDILEQNGHEIIPFSIRHNKNKPTEYEKYFLDPIGSGNETFSNEYNKNSPGVVFKALSRMIYSFEAKRKFTKLLKEVQPDLVYLLYYHNKISSSVIDAAYDLKIPVVQRISDFGHICPANIFYILHSKQLCERCLHGSKWNAVAHKCVQNSYTSSFIKTLALKVQDIRQTINKISAFVIPAEFTAQKHREYGIEPNRINHVPTFFNGTKEVDVTYEKFFLYIGRLDKDKGIITLIQAFLNTSYKLIIIGSSGDGSDFEINELLKSSPNDITLLGKLDFSEIRPYLASCLCTICPSEWYENFPNSVLESFGFQKAVIASDLGSLKEMIISKETGLRFEHGNPSKLQECVKYLYENVVLAKKMGQRAQEKLESEYSSELHYDKLIKIFENVISKKLISKEE